MRHFFSVKKKVELDECPGCGGFWLDAGELSKIRSLFNTEEEKQKAADEYFSEIFGDKLTAMKSDKVRKISNMFRFICPSYYIPGKQDWGAF
jgi:Zn-finger nucleic acid-binding protein